MDIIKNKNSINMLEGTLIDKLIIFALPLALTSILQQLFNVCDIIVCGRFVGSLALAAVGANSQIINLFVNSFVGLSVGVNVLIANYIGAKKYEQVHNVIQTSITFALGFGIFLFIVGSLLVRRFLVFLGTPNEIFEPAVLYLRIYFIGLPFFSVYNFGAAILRSIGDTKRPLFILIISGIINTILNVILVVFFNLGVTGVAIATSFSNFVSCIVVIILLMREKGLIHYNIKEWYIVPDSLKKFLLIGVPSSVQGMVFSLSNLCVQSAINSLGANTIAANAAAVNFEIFPLYIFSSFGNACGTFVSQNFGALKFDRCIRVRRDCILLGALFSIILTFFLQVFAREIITLFTTDQDVIEISMVRIRIAGSFAWLQVIYDSTAATLRSIKHPILPSVMIIIGTVVFRVIWILIFFPTHKSYQTIALTYPLSWLIINIAMLIAYYFISKKTFVEKTRNQSV